MHAIELHERLLRASPGAAEGILTELEGTTDHRLRNVAGRFCVHQARQGGSPDTNQEWLDRAETNFARALALSTSGNCGLDQATTRALIEQAHLPIYKETAVEEIPPRPKTIRSTYEELLEAGQLCAEWLNYLGNQSPDSQHRESERTVDLVGLMSEFSVMALLHRYATDEIADGSWYALPSTLGEDYHITPSGTRPRHNSSNWDIGVYTKFDEQPADLVHKVQVKTARYRDTVHEFDPDIACVAVRPDLVLPGERTFTNTKIINECAVELYTPDPSRVRPILDQRTGQLLDILG